MDRKTRLVEDKQGRTNVILPWKAFSLAHRTCYKQLQLFLSHKVEGIRNSCLGSLLWQRTVKKFLFLVFKRIVMKERDLTIPVSKLVFDRRRLYIKDTRKTWSKINVKYWASEFLQHKISQIGWSDEAHCTNKPVCAAYIVPRGRV
jgi:hypothetical protein